MSGLNQKIRDAKRKVHRAVRMAEAARKHAAEGKAASSSIHTEVRTNVEVRMNLGSDGEAQDATAVQYAPIRQGRESD